MKLIGETAYTVLAVRLFRGRSKGVSLFSVDDFVFSPVCISVGPTAFQKFLVGSGDPGTIFTRYTEHFPK